MRIRNINDYLTKQLKRTHPETPELTTANDDLLTKIGGERESLDIFRVNTLEQLTSFATDSYDQILFELLQNAKDEQSSGLWVFFKKGLGIVFINDGNPFHTTPEIRKGSLYSFLGKGVGRKGLDDNSSGKYGKGSKLIYNLLVPRNDAAGSAKNDSERLADIMIKDYKAPILFSWENGHDLSTLANDVSFQDTITAGDCESKYAILVKLFLSYYPATPGQKVLLDGKDEIVPFNESDFQGFQSCVREALKLFQEDQIFYRPGSLLYLPAPDAVIDELVEAFEKEQIAEELEQTCSMLASNENNRISKVVVNNKTYRAFETTSFHFSLESGESEDSSEFSIVIDTEFKSEISKKINFFTDYFPISKEKHKLGYAVACKDFPITDDRQSLRKSVNNLLASFENEFELSWESKVLDKKSDYRNLLIGIVNSELDTENTFREEIASLHNQLLELASNNLPTNLDGYKPSQEVYLFPETIHHLPLRSFFDGYSLSHDLYEYKEQFEDTFNLEALSLSEIIRKSDKAAFKSFMEKSDSSIHRDIWRQLEVENDFQGLEEIPLVRCTDNRFRSINELKSDSNGLFSFPHEEFKFLKEFAIAAGKWCNEGVALFDPLHKEQFPFFNKWMSKHLTIDALKDKLLVLKPAICEKSTRLKIDIISALSALDHDSDSFIDDFDVFKLINGHYKPLSKIPKKHPRLITDLLKNYTPVEEHLFNDAVKKHLMDVFKLHELVVNDGELESKVQSSNYEVYEYLSDVLTLYEESDTDEDILSGSESILRVARGWTSFERVFFSRTCSKLNEQAYEHLKVLVSDDEWETLEFDQEFFDLLSKKPFASLFGEKKLRDALPGKRLAQEQSIDALIEYHEISKDSFFSVFNISLTDNSYELIKEGNKQISNEPASLSDFLKEHNWVLLPERWRSWNFSSDSGLINASSEQFLSNLIVVHGSLLEFVHAVKPTSEALKIRYLNGIDRIDIDLDDSYGEKTNEVSIINMILELHKGERLRELIVIDSVKWKDIGVENEIFCNGHKYELVQLLTMYAQESSSLQDLLSTLSAVRLRTELRDALEIESKSIEDIKNEVFALPEINSYAFCFLIDASIQLEEKIDSSIFNHRLSEKIQFDVIELLNEAFKMNIKGSLEYWSKCFIESDLEKIYPKNNSLWLPEEIIDSDIINWVGDDESKRKFVKKQLTNQSKVKSIEEERSRLKDDGNFKVEKVYDLQMLASTLNWINSEGITVNRIKANQILRNKDQIQELGANKFVFEDWERPSKLLVKNSFKFILEPESIDKAHLIANAEIHPSEVIYAQEESYSKFLYENTDLIPLRIEKELVQDSNDVHEWPAKSYLAWKKQEKNHLYEIKLTQSEVPFSFKLFANERFYSHLAVEKSGEIGKIERSTADSKQKNFLLVIDKESLVDDNEILQKIISNEKDLFQHQGGKEDLMKLISVFHQAATERIKELEQQQSDKEQKLKDRIDELQTQLSSGASAGDKGEGSGSGSGNLQVDGLEEIREIEAFKKSIDQFKDAFEKLGSERMKKALNKLLSEEEDEDARPSELSGYIGEQLVYQWLRTRVKSENAIWLGYMQKPYDIEIGEDIKIEVKTKVATLYDEEKAYKSTALYIRKSQIEYLAKIADTNKKYFLVVLSLHDLGLKGLYQKHKIQFDQDNELTENLMEKIDADIVEYMKSNEDRNSFVRNLEYLQLNDQKTIIVREETS